MRARGSTGEIPLGRVLPIGANIVFLMTGVGIVRRSCR